MTALEAHIDALAHLETREVRGRVASVRGLSVLVDDLTLPVGALVRLDCSHASQSDVVRGEVVGFDGARSVVMLFGSASGITPGTQVIGEQSAQVVRVGASLLGRVIDALGRPIDGKAAPGDLTTWPLHPTPTPALARRRIRDPLPTGVRTVDGLVTIGKGQRVGVFAGPGVGKSTLLAMMARNTSADVNVFALVGERGREVKDFIESALGEEGMRRSVIIVATSDESPLLRVRAAELACSVAEYFRGHGADCLLMMDSITRFAQAQRQIGLTVGEQPATKGYTPSVFAMLPALLERAGAIEGGGSITGIYTVLVEGDDLSEPISDAARGILDGHIVLSRKLASRGHFPAIDANESVSRVADDVCDEGHVAARRLILRLIAAYRDAEELINIGAYAEGSNPDCDVAIRMKEQIAGFLTQNSGEQVNYPETCRDLVSLGTAAHGVLQQLSAERKSAASG